jgi:hypothetical protein
MDVYRLHKNLLENGIPIHGVNSNRIIHFEDGATQQQIDDGNAIAQGWDTLTVSSDKESIASDNVEEAVITCVELPTVFDYNVHLGDEVVLSGSVGDGSLEYSTNVSGSYIIEIIEQGTYNTGYAKLEVI